MTAAKNKARSFWAKAEAAGEGMEVALRAFLGLMFAIGFASFGFWLGSQVHAGIGLIIALILIPIGFLIGFFWVEVKFVMKLILGSMFE